MRILLVGPAQSIHVRRWAQFLVQQGHRVVMLTELPPAEPIEGVDLRVAPLAEMPRALRLAAGAIALRAIQRQFRPDAVHIQSVGSTSALAFFLKRGRVVVSPWGSDVLRPSSLVHRLLAARTLARADLVLTTSEQMRSQVQEVVGDPNLPIATISWGADIALFRAPSEGGTAAAREALGIPAQAILLVSTRSTTPEYRIHEVVQAFALASAKRPDLHLLLLAGFDPSGDAAGARARQYRREVWAAAHAVGHVTLIDRRLTEGEMATVLAAADVAISVPGADQRATSVIEALCCGLPVLGSDIGPYRELADEGFDIRLVGDPITATLARALAEAKPAANADRELRAATAKAREDRAVQYGRIEEALRLVADTRGRGRVWIVNHYAAPPTEGVGTRHFDMARVLRRHGHPTVIFAASFSHFSGREMRLSGPQLTSHETASGVVFRWIRTLPYRGNGVSRLASMLVFAGLLPVVQLLHRRPEVVIGSTVHPFAALSALLVARMRRAAFIYEVRDLWPETLVDMGALRAHSPAARLLARLQAYLCRSADHVICLMPGAVDYLSHMARQRVPVTYLPNGVDLAAIETPPPSQPVEAVRAARDRASFVVAYVGSFGPANGLDTLIESAGLLERDHPGLVHLLLVGDGPRRQHLDDLVRTWVLPNVTLVSPIPKTSVRPFLRSVDACVFHLLPLPVFRFGVSPNKLMDYFAASRPVVFACSALNNPVDEANAGVSVPPADPNALARAIVRLAQLSADEREILGRNGQEFARRKHDIERLGEELAAIIETVRRCKES